MKIDSTKIRLLLAEQGLTQVKLSETCGIPAPHISLILTRGTCSAINLGKLARALGVNSGEIVKEEL